MEGDWSSQDDLPVGIKAHYFRPWERAAKNEEMAFPPAQHPPPLDPVQPPTTPDRESALSKDTTYRDRTAPRKSTSTDPPSRGDRQERDLVEPAQAVTKGTKQERVNVPVPQWQRKLNPNCRNPATCCLPSVNAPLYQIPRKMPVLFWLSTEKEPTHS